MKTTKTKPKLALPPTNTTAEDAMQAMIKKGGSPVASEEPATAAAEDVMKSFTIKVYASELQDIKSILEANPTDRRFGKKKTGSIHNFIVDAVNEKIAREKKKLN